MSTPDSSPDVGVDAASADVVDTASADVLETADVTAAADVTAPVDVADRGFLDELDDDEPDAPERHHTVTAVLVAHDGERWLPATISAVSRGTRRPDRLVVVDTGSTDDTPAQLERARAAGVVHDIVTLPRETGFGAAVAAGLEAAGVDARPVEPDQIAWVWLLHDDSAPAADALEQLLRTSDRNLSADVLGPKQRGWNNTDVLVEVGVTIARSGSRVTGLEHRELDQGQHDGVLDVLAVGSAGMLVRREVWESLEGFDPALPSFRDDLDFCWRAHRAGHRVILATSAVVHHREAATHGRRPMDAGSPRHPDRPHRIDRVAGIHVMRAHSHGLARPFVTLRLLLGALVRALAYLLGKAPDRARDEWGAFRESALGRSGLSQSRARAARAAASPSAVPESDVRTMLAPRGTQARHALATLGDLVAGRDTGDAGRSVLDSTTDDPDGWYADDRRTSRTRRFFTTPAVVLVLGLLVATLVGARELLGSGVLEGGALLPAPEGAGDLWASYLTPWHEVGPGSSSDAPTWLVPLTLLATLLRGSASSAVDVVLLGLIPLAGLTSYLALRGLVGSTWLRVWAAATYATLPVVTGALSGGRIGTAVSVVLLPWLVRSAARLVGVGGRSGTWRRAFGTGLLLAIVTAFTPVAWIITVLVALVGGLTLVRDRAGRLRLLVTVLLPIALLVPWSLRVVRQPVLLVLEPGFVGPTDAHLRIYDVVLLRPGGAGSTPVWLGLGLVVTGIVALAVPSGRRPVVAAWVVGGIALLVGSIESLMRVTPPPLATPVTPWPGIPTAIWGAALILCATLTVDRVFTRLVDASFGWRQPSAAVLSMLLLLAPICSIALVIIGVDGPIRRGSREVLPAFVSAQMHTPLRPRSLVLQRGSGGSIVYDLLAAPTSQTGDIDVAAPADVSTQLDLLIGRLVGGVGGDEVAGLATHGVGFVVLSDLTPGTDPLVATLDGERGLRRLSSESGGAVWQIAEVSSRAQIVNPAPSVSAGTVVTRSATALPVSSTDPRVVSSLDATIQAGTAGRRAIMSEAADDRWHWTLNGTAVPAQPLSVSAGPADASGGSAAAVTDPSVQQLPLSGSATTVTAAFDGSSRTTWLWIELLVLVVTVVLALPSTRTEEDDDAEGDTNPVDPDADLLAEVPVAATATTSAPHDVYDEPNPEGES